MPAVAGWGVVASGFGLTMGASEGWGGGVARSKSSLRTYVPIAALQRPVLERGGAASNEAGRGRGAYPLQQETGLRELTICCWSRSWGSHDPRREQHCMPPGWDISAEGGARY